MFLTIVVVLDRIHLLFFFFNSFSFMTAGDLVWMFCIWELLIVFKLSEEGTAAICLYCKAEVLWHRW